MFLLFFFLSIYMCICIFWKQTIIVIIHRWTRSCNSWKHQKRSSFKPPSSAWRVAAWSNTCSHSVLYIYIFIIWMKNEWTVQEALDQLLEDWYGQNNSGFKWDYYCKKVQHCSLFPDCTHCGMSRLSDRCPFLELLAEQGGKIRKRVFKVFISLGWLIQLLGLYVCAIM